LSIGFYDNNIAKASINVPARGNRKTSSILADVRTLPVYGATGISWDMLVGDTGVNRLATYASVFNSSANSSVKLNQEEDYEIEFGYTGYTNTVDVRVLDHYDWLLNESMVLTFGMELQYLNIFGKHEDVFKLKFEQTGLDFDDETETYTIQKHIYRAYGFTEYSWNFDIVETVSTVGLTQIIKEDGTSFERTFPSARLSTTFNFSEKWKLALVESISPSSSKSNPVCSNLSLNTSSCFPNIFKY
jgi:hypothetical protein